MQNQAWEIALLQTILLCTHRWFSEKQRPIYHRQLDLGRTVCGIRLRRLNTQIIREPTEETQCVICKYNLPTVHLIITEKKPKGKGPVPPPIDYNPDPPAQRLQLPLVAAT